MAPTTPKTASRSAGRNSSPAPKATAKASAKAGSVGIAEAPQEKEPQPKVQETPKVVPADADSNVSHQFLFVVFTGLAMAIGVYVLNNMRIELAVPTFWLDMRAPIEKVFVEHADLLVALGALISFSPLLLILGVNAFRAAGDLNALNDWQKAVVLSLVTIALACYGFTEGPAKWQSISTPVQKFFVDNANNMVAATAVIAFAPMALIAWVLAFRCVTGTVSGIVAPATAEKKEEKLK